jgi:enoyl-CoA hydratase
MTMLEREDRGEIAVLRMAHGKASALDTEFARALAEAFEEFQRGPARALVLTGSGSIFSAGVDLFRVTKEGAPYLDAFLPALSRAIRSLFTLEKPVVAAINGHAIAGGCILACACDHRILARGAGRIGVPELLVGVPFPAAALEVMRFALAPPQLQEAVLTGATYAPEAALARGFAEELVDPVELPVRALAVARQHAAVPRTSFALTKRILRRPAVERMLRHADAFDQEMAAAWRSDAVLATMREYVARTIKK